MITIEARPTSGEELPYLSVDHFQRFEPFLLHHIILRNPPMVSNGRCEEEVHVCTTMTLNEFVYDGGVKVSL